MQESALRILAARLVVELSSYDRRNGDGVRNGRENALPIRAGVQIDQYARVENERPEIVN